MKIPCELKKLLESDSKSSALVYSVIGCLEKIYKDNKMPFFPEYTDHGIEHVEGVIQTAWALMSTPARKEVKSRDAEVLILSCLFHDFAMHLSKDGFVTLVSHNDWKVVKEFGDEPWEKMWLDFTSEARRFDGRTLKRIFGTPEPITMPELDPEKWDAKQLKLIGEFIRRHHHRLAHQIVINGGMPGVDGKKLQFPQIDEVIADLTGLVARSHGLPIRENLKYLDKYHARQEYQKIHCVFLMTLLRIADYLQVESDRAPEQILAIKQLRSPISQREWRCHDAVKDIKSGDDVESLFIQVKPKDVETYLLLRELLNSIQYELDCSWAVLGEVYSRFTNEKWNRFGLSLRRVTSNLDDLDEFSKQVSYVPCKAAFDTAGAELMNLLIEPLYGKRPEIAIRELVQNAVDAVREFNEYIKLNGDIGKVERPEQSADVLVNLISNDDGIFLKVEDKGIGMTPDTLQNYFLKAGASFRSSLEWRKTFENENKESRVLRSGRFGIGVFAVLLLGDKVNVSSRHITKESGIEFEASLADEFVEFHKIDRPVGTSISIRISEEIAFELLEEHEEWAWYVLEKPVVERHIKITNKKFLLRLIQKKVDSNNPKEDFLIDQIIEDKLPHRLYSLPDANAILSADWNRIEHRDFLDLQWTYSLKVPLITCNGIIVAKQFYSNSYNEEINRYSLADHINEDMDREISFKIPNCSCFDHNGKLPLSLQRTGLTRSYPFMKELQESVLHDFFAFALIYAPTTPICDSQSFKDYLNTNYHGLKRGQDINFLPLIGSPCGVTIAESWLFRQNVRDTAIGILLFEGDYPDDVHEIFFKNNLVLGENDYYLGDQIDIDFDDFLRYGNPVKYRYFNSHYLEEKSDSLSRHYNQESYVKVNNSYMSEYENQDTTWQNLKWHLSQNWDAINYLVVQWFYDEQDMPEQSVLAKHWMDIIGHAAIPYDLKERETKLAPAYRKLDKYIQKWRLRKQAGNAK